MIIVYDAANSLEAHVVKGMLEQEGIPAYIQGEHLQSGIGELPAISSLVKVSVDNLNYEKSRKIILEWQRSEHNSELDTNKRLPEKQNKTDEFNFFHILLAFLFGAVCMHIYLKPATTHNALDRNKDGVNDEIWTYENNIAVKSELDKNLDGKIDEITIYQDGLILNGSIDENFDGKFDTEHLYDKGNIYYSKTDINNDGEIDSFIDYEINTPRYKNSIVNPKNGLIKKIQYYEMNKLISAELDSNNDGNLDTLIKYDVFEEEVYRNKFH